ncbi:nucleotide sugar dehydrogenase [Candidatus Uabimicrobium amorphum]|uniref:UDP-N-acetyl-D-glucosamine dehydrogenase n=1 Tax=Uabimicrobium amorphum TaxID=2596890 RepID=A0A5S9IVI8_UABAM|nr:nucleotide sugar dehydrogenase [Candidatus Uabimicrobium amorphum]BBM88281.1 UDP-N-acetyl-D-glucosamine dehydrogenase [Candidatus Uabimicrobium amorphum]
MLYDSVIVGGFGHVGLPLAISLADKGQKVCALDINREVGDLIEKGQMPFIEHGAQEILQRVINRQLFLAYDPKVISETNTVIVIIGTPVDQHLNPELDPIIKLIDDYLEFFHDEQLIILRSTVYPGTSEKVKNWLHQYGKNVDVAFCPERIAEGYAMEELQKLPQIISSFSPQGLERCRELFSLLTDDIVCLEPIEAELSKLFTNVWRYIKFATSNQFFMIANNHNVDFYRILHAMTHNYKRASDFASPGFAAGPCLFKDAMQLAAFNNNNFFLGHSAMLINEGLPNYIVSKLKEKYPLQTLTTGILGMAFKANIDDKRESLSYKLKKVLMFESKKVLCSDCYINDEKFISHEQLIEQSDIIILGVPHTQYKDMNLPKDKIVVDVWNLWGNGCIV